MRVALLVLGAIALAMGPAGCAAPSGPSTPSGPAGTCGWTAPSRDPGVPVEACAADPLTQSVVLGHGADLLPVTITLYTDGAVSCTPHVPACAVEDNRPLLPAGSPAPPVDPSRSRATLTLDWQDRRATLRQAPRCHVPAWPDPRTATGPVPQTCHTAPAADFQVTTAPGSAAPWHFAVALTLPGDPGERPVATVADRWQIALDPTTGALDLIGEGVDSPAFALVNLGTVACADPGAPDPPPARPTTQHYSCHAHVPPNP